MKEFIFTITETYTTDYCIQAETEEQARRIVEEKYMAGEIDVEFFDTCDIVAAV